MSEKLLKVNETEDIDVIMSSLFASDNPTKKEEKESVNIINGIIDSNLLPSKVIPITMRKLAAYQNALKQKEKEKEKDIRTEVLPINLRKRLLYERMIKQ